MILIFVVGALFYNYAKRNDLNKILWAILGVASYYVGQLIAGVIIGLLNPNLLDDQVALIVIGIIAGAATTYITYQIMVNQSKKVKQNKPDSDILDQDLDDF